MTTQLFPETEKYITQTDMLNKHKGNQAQIYRILGQGNTKSRELELPPATIERKMELVVFKLLQNNPEIPQSVKAEIDQTRTELEKELSSLKKNDVQKRLGNQALRSLEGIKSGFKDNVFFAGRLVLTHDKAAVNWSWSLTQHYPIISKIPPDPEYLVKSYHEAESRLQELILPAEQFDFRLNIAWMLARQFSKSENVLIVDVARMYKIAGQQDKFWKTPKRSNFTDLPEAAFIANLINWRRHQNSSLTPFDFAQATVHQALGKNAKVFYMPTNAEGTQTRPVSYIKKRV
jgi:hypothetical protein